jgi:glycosyltransferase involved in cell wall biosynthesis
VTGRPGAAGLTVSYLLGSSAGGTLRHVLMVAGGSQARGAHVAVYGPAAALAAACGPVEGGPVRCDAVEIAGRPRPARDAATLRRLRQLLDRDQPGVLHAHGLRAGALAALALRRRPAGGRPALAVTVHNAPPPGPAAAVYTVLEWLVARRADAVLTVSPDLAERMRRRGARLAGRALVPAPVTAVPPAAEVAALRAGLGGPGQPVVLAVGRLAGQKGFGTLIEAAARWQQPAPARPGRPRSAGAVLVIAGEGPLLAGLRRQAGRAGARVRFLGYRPDVPALLAAADVVAVPSTWEGQPLIVQEALRAGRPLVASRVPGIAELTGPGGAVLVPPGDPAALAAAVARLLDDEAAAAAQAVSARAQAARLPTPDLAVTQVLALYQRLSASTGPGSASTGPGGAGSLAP